MAPRKAFGLAMSIAVLAGMSLLHAMKILRFYSSDDWQETSHPRSNTTSDDNLLLKASFFVENRSVLSYGPDDMNSFVEHGFHREFCQRILKSRDPNNTAPSLVNVSFSCEDVYRKSHFGTGNFVMSTYILRSTARTMGNVDVLLHCSDASLSRSSLVLPWITGYFQYSHETASPIVRSASDNSNCRNIQRTVPDPLVQSVRDIRMDLRRMAVGLVGVPGREHPSYGFAQKFTEASHPIRKYGVDANSDNPVLHGTLLDDTVLHFRCGDLIDSEETRYGFMKFDSYANHVSPTSMSIGIVTESFDEHGQHRKAENRSTTRERCRTVVQAFALHLQQRFPSANVSIRNGQGETVALSYARMIMANETIVGLSTFAFFPAIAAFGRSLIRRPDPKNLGAWLTKIDLEYEAENVKLIVEKDWLPAKRCKRLWEKNETQVLEWFKSPVASGTD